MNLDDSESLAAVAGDPNFQPKKVLRSVCCVCVPKAMPGPGEQLSHGYCRLHYLELADAYDLATSWERIELVLRQHPGLLLVAAFVLYWLWHVSTWALHGFAILGAGQ